MFVELNKLLYLRSYNYDNEVDCFWYVTQYSLMKIYHLLWNLLHRYSGVPTCSLETTGS